MSIEKQSSEFMTPQLTYGDTLRFTAYAWAKLLYMRNKGPTEVAGYGITGTDDPLLITDFKLVKQECTSVSFDLDPNDSTEFLETMIDEGLMPWQCSNILIHSHPSNCPNPSTTDEANFKKAFSHPNWAIMLIVAQDSTVYCRLKINIGPGVIKEIEVIVDWSTPFAGSDMQKWEAEYKSKVSEQKFVPCDINDPLWYNDKEDRWIGFNHQQQEEYNEIEDNCFLEITGEVTYWHDDEEIWYNYDPLEQKWYKEDETNGSSLEIPTPTQPWAQQVVAWANKNASEYAAVIEQQSQIQE